MYKYNFITLVVLSDDFTVKDNFWVGTRRKWGGYRKRRYIHGRKYTKDSSDVRRKRCTNVKIKTLISKLQGEKRQSDIRGSPVPKTKEVTILGSRIVYLINTLLTYECVDSFTINLWLIFFLVLLLFFMKRCVQVPSPQPPSLVLFLFCFLTKVLKTRFGSWRKEK